MNLQKLTLEEVFLLRAFVVETLQNEDSKYLSDKLERLNQEILNRLDKV